MYVYVSIYTYIHTDRVVLGLQMNSARSTCSFKARGPSTYRYPDLWDDPKSRTPVLDSGTVMVSIIEPKVDLLFGSRLEP